LRRGIETFGDALDERVGTSVESMADHYRDSVELIESEWPDSTFLLALRLELKRLEAESSRAVGPGVRY